MFLIRILPVALMCLASAALSEEVEITLADTLDGELSGYCLDIRGPQDSANPNDGLQAHTCYSYQGALGVDQSFASDRLADSQLYMPAFDVCAYAKGTTQGAELGLAACDDIGDRHVLLEPTGKLIPAAAPDMCFTAGSETRRGRGGTSPHQIKSLTLQACSETLTPYQIWQARGLTK